MRKTLISGMAILVVAVSAVTVMAQNKPADEKVEVRESKPIRHMSNHKPFKESVSEKTFNKVSAAWENAKTKVINQFLAKEGNAIEEDWRLVSITDINLELTDQLTEVESSSFNAALYSDEKVKHTEIGDTIPAILLNEAKDRAILMLVKPNGDVIVIDMKSKADNNLRQWYVEGEAHRLK